MGEEDEESLEEILLTNQVTPGAGAFKDFLESGSVSGYAGGVPYSSSMSYMRQWKKYSKLYRICGEDSAVLYFYADPLYRSNFRESNSGLYIDKNGKAEPLFEAGECGGSMGGDRLCLWYDTKEGTLKPGTSGSYGGFGGSLGSEDVYILKDGEAVLENSFQHYYQSASNYSEETLLENAELFYDEEGEAYTKDTILEAEYVEECILNEKQVSIEEYHAAEKRYRYYNPLLMR